MNAESHGPKLQSDLYRCGVDARTKYMREIQRVPMIISTTDGFMSKEGFRALDALTNIAIQDMPVGGPRLMLIAGFALCEAAAGAYDTWYCEARSALPIHLGGAASGA